MSKARNKKRKRRFEELPLPSKEKIDALAKTLTKQIDKEVFARNYAPASEVLKLVGSGAFLVTSAFMPNLPRALRPYLKDESSYQVWKRFNIPYLKRTLNRLARQRLVEIKDEEGKQVVKITNSGRKKILKYSLDEIKIEKPKSWDGKWRLISYDLLKGQDKNRDILRFYLDKWGFYPIHKSVYLHAYPCEKEIEFLREYLRIGKNLLIFIVSSIEDDKIFRQYFGV